MERSSSRTSFSAVQHRLKARDVREQNVSVFVHIRPLSGKERLAGSKDIVEVDESSTEVFIDSEPPIQYVFDRIFGSNALSPHLMVRECVDPLVTSVFQGYNSTLLAYGQTGSGKSFTLGTYRAAQGEDRTWQPLLRAAAAGCFQRQTELLQQGHHVRLRCSFIEVYQDTVNDLLNGSVALPVRDPDPSKDVILVGLQRHETPTLGEMEQFLQTGLKMRAVSATKSNAYSSRSHAIFTIHVTCTRMNDSSDDERVDGLASARSSMCGSVCSSMAPQDGGAEVTEGKLHLVDLAGSERVKKAGIQSRMSETCCINQGLLALGNVIEALSEKTRPHVPYRDHILTRILRNSLGGNGKTVMVACVSPADNHISETIQTLKYAARARQIKNKPVARRRIDPSKELVKLKHEKLCMERELELVREQLKLLQSTLPAEVRVCMESTQTSPAKSVKGFPPVFSDFQHTRSAPTDTSPSRTSHHFTTRTSHVLSGQDPLDPRQAHNDRHAASCMPALHSAHIIGLPPMHSPTHHRRSLSGTVPFSRLAQLAVSASDTAHQEYYSSPRSCWSVDAGYSPAKTRIPSGPQSARELPSPESTLHASSYTSLPPHVPSPQTILDGSLLLAPGAFQDSVLLQSVDLDAMHRVLSGSGDDGRGFNAMHRVSNGSTADGPALNAAHRVLSGSTVDGRSLNAMHRVSSGSVVDDRGPDASFTQGPNREQQSQLFDTRADSGVRSCSSQRHFPGTPSFAAWSCEGNAGSIVRNSLDQNNTAVSPAESAPLDFLLGPNTVFQMPAVDRAQSLRQSIERLSTRSHSSGSATAGRDNMGHDGAGMLPSRQQASGTAPLRSHSGSATSTGSNTVGVIGISPFSSAQQSCVTNSSRSSRIYEEIVAATTAADCKGASGGGENTHSWIPYGCREPGASKEEENTTCWNPYGAVTRSSSGQPDAARTLSSLSSHVSQTLHAHGSIVDDIVRILTQSSSTDELPTVANDLIYPSADKKADQVPESQPLLHDAENDTFCIPTSSSPVTGVGAAGQQLLDTSKVSIPARAKTKHDGKERHAVQPSLHDPPRTRDAHHQPQASQEVSEEDGNHHLGTTHGLAKDAGSTASFTAPTGRDGADKPGVADARRPERSPRSNASSLAQHAAPRDPTHSVPVSTLDSRPTYWGPQPTPATDPLGSPHSSLPTPLHALDPVAPTSPDAIAWEAEKRCSTSRPWVVTPDVPPQHQVPSVSHAMLGRFASCTIPAAHAAMGQGSSHAGIFRNASCGSYGRRGEVMVDSLAVEEFEPSELFRERLPGMAQGLELIRQRSMQSCSRDRVREHLEEQLMLATQGRELEAEIQAQEQILHDMEQQLQVAIDQLITAGLQYKDTVMQLQREIHTQQSKVFGLKQQQQMAMLHPLRRYLDTIGVDEDLNTRLSSAADSSVFLNLLLDGALKQKLGVVVDVLFNIAVHYREQLLSAQIPATPPPSLRSTHPESNASSRHRPHQPSLQTSVSDPHILSAVTAPLQHRQLHTSRWSLDSTRSRRAEDSMFMLLGNRLGNLSPDVNDVTQVNGVDATASCGTHLISGNAARRMVAGPDAADTLSSTQISTTSETQTDNFFGSEPVYRLGAAARFVTAQRAKRSRAVTELLRGSRRHTRGAGSKASVGMTAVGAKPEEDVPISQAVPTRSKRVPPQSLHNTPKRTTVSKAKAMHDRHQSGVRGPADQGTGWTQRYQTQADALQQCLQDAVREVSSSTPRTALPDAVGLTYTMGTKSSMPPNDTIGTRLTDPPNDTMGTKLSTPPTSPEKSTVSATSVVSVLSQLSDHKLAAAPIVDSSLLMRQRAVSHAVEAVKAQPVDGNVSVECKTVDLPCGQMDDAELVGASDEELTSSRPAVERNRVGLRNSLTNGLKSLRSLIRQLTPDGLSPDRASLCTSPAHNDACPEDARARVRDVGTCVATEQAQPLDATLLTRPALKGQGGHTFWGDDGGVAPGCETPRLVISAQDQALDVTTHPVLNGHTGHTAGISDGIAATVADTPRPLMSAKDPFLPGYDVQTLQDGGKMEQERDDMLSSASSSSGSPQNSLTSSPSGAQDAVAVVDGAAVVVPEASGEKAVVSPSSRGSLQGRSWMLRAGWTSSAAHAGHLQEESRRGRRRRERQGAAAASAVQGVLGESGEDVEAGQRVGINGHGRERKVTKTVEQPQHYTRIEEVMNSLWFGELD